MQRRVLAALLATAAAVAAGGGAEDAAIGRDPPPPPEDPIRRWLAGLVVSVPSVSFIVPGTILSSDVNVTLAGLCAARPPCPAAAAY